MKGTAALAHHTSNTDIVGMREYDFRTSAYGKEITMTTFALIHGGGTTGWDWHLVARELRGLGHGVVAPDLPNADESKKLNDYADAVVAAIHDILPDGATDDVVVVAHSLGGFTAPLVCHRFPARLLVMVTAMIPRPGENAMDWWSATGQDRATAASHYDEHDLFFHDVSTDLAAEAERRATDQSYAAMQQPWPADDWPRVDTKFVLCQNDRLFPAAWMRDLVKRRLDITPDEIDSGHYAPLAQPSELAHRLDAYTR